MNKILITAYFFVLISIPISLYIYKQYTIPKNLVQAPESQKIVKNDSKLINLTNKLIKASEDKKPNQNSEQLIEIASERKKEALKLIKKDPEKFLAQAMPADVREKLPDEVKGFVEKQIEVKGDLSVIHSDGFDAKKSFNDFYLSENSRKYNLHFAKKEPSLKAQQNVFGKAIALDSELIFKQGDNLRPQSNVQGVEAATGSKKVLVILFNFLNDQRRPFTKDQVYQTIFGDYNSVNAYFKEASGGRLSISGEVIDWRSQGVNFGSDPCIKPTASLTNALLLGNNTPLNFDQYIFISPKMDCQTEAGSLAGRADTINAIWMNGVNDVQIYVHELGHNIGINHAADLRCGSNSIDSYDNCNIYEYGDYLDSMGNYNKISPHYNSPHKLSLGWIGANQIIDVNESGTYTISPLEENGQSLAIRIPKKDTGEDYFLEYRQPIGFDSSLPNNPYNGAVLHITSASNSNTPWDPAWTKLVHPNNNSSLSDGASFFDKQNGITITQVSHDPGKVTLDIRFGDLTCSSLLPTLSIDPPEQAGPAGKPITYKISVRNTSTVCPANELYTTLSGLNGTPVEKISGFFPTKINLAPGETKNFDLTLVSKEDKPEGDYNFEFMVYNNAKPEENVKTLFSYVIFNSNFSSDQEGIYRDNICSQFDGNLDDCNTNNCSYFDCTKTCWPKGTTIQIGCNPKAKNAPKCTTQSEPESKLYDCSNNQKCFNDFKLDPLKCVVPKTNLDGKTFHCDNNNDECRGRGIGWVGTTGCGNSDNLANQVSEELSCINGLRCWNDFYRDEDTQCSWTSKDPSSHCMADDKCSAQPAQLSQGKTPTLTPAEKEVTLITLGDQLLWSKEEGSYQLNLNLNYQQLYTLYVHYSEGTPRTFNLTFAELTQKTAPYPTQEEQSTPIPPPIKPPEELLVTGCEVDNDYKEFFGCDSSECGFEQWVCFDSKNERHIKSFHEDNGHGCACPVPNNCLTTCGQNNGQNCTNKEKADIECSNYWGDNSICNFTEKGPHKDGCIPQ